MVDWSTGQLVDWTHSFNRRAIYLLFAVLLDVVEAEGEDLEDNLIENLYPIFVFRFVFHKDKNLIVN